MFVIKLGGSVITDKAKEQYFRKEVMDRLAAELYKANKQVILVHGAGSFGHILAKKYKLNDGFKRKNQLEGFARTQAMVQELNALVLSSLHSHRIPAVSILPHAMLTLSNHSPKKVDYSIIKQYLDLGCMPVCCGDVALDKKLGFSICSGDLLVQLLAATFKPKKVIFVLDEDGLYSANPKTEKNATFIKTATIQHLRKLSTQVNTYADVTKGMKGKLFTIRQIASNNIDTILINGNIHNRLYDTLKGKKVKCTMVYGDRT